MNLTIHDPAPALRRLRAYHLATLGGVIFVLGVAVGIALAPGDIRGDGTAEVHAAAPIAGAEAIHWELDILGATGATAAQERTVPLAPVVEHIHVPTLSWELDILGAEQSRAVRPAPTSEMWELAHMQ